MIVKTDYLVRSRARNGWSPLSRSSREGLSQSQTLDGRHDQWERITSWILFWQDYEPAMPLRGVNVSPKQCCQTPVLSVSCDVVISVFAWRSDMRLVCADVFWTYTLKCDCLIGIRSMVVRVQGNTVPRIPFASSSPKNIYS